jgi:hypothetical protein
VSKDSDQTETAPRKFKLGPLGSLNQVTKGPAKTIRAMADGTLDSQVGARICGLLATGQTLCARGPAPMKPSALRIERLLAKVEAELACSARARRYVFHYDEVAEAEAQGLPYVLVPRVLSRREWMERYAKQ